MKKLIVLILAITYLSTSSGMVMSVQYCFDKISSIQVNGFGNDDSCCCTGAEKTAGCCSHDIKVVKLQETHQAAFAHYSINNPTSLPLIPQSSIDSALTVQCGEQVIQISDSSPPIASTPPIYLKHCVFRI